MMEETQRPVYLERCLVCDHKCYLTEIEQVELEDSRRVSDVRRLFYTIFSIPASPYTLSTLAKEELPLCPTCTFNMGRIRAVHDQLKRIQNDFNKLKEQVAFAIVDIVASSRRGGTTSKVDYDWKSMSEDAIEQCLMSAEVDTLQQFIFHEWHEKHPSSSSSGDFATRQQQQNNEAAEHHQTLKRKMEHKFLEPSVPSKLPSLRPLSCGTFGGSGKKLLPFKMICPPPQLKSPFKRHHSPIPKINLPRNNGQQQQLIGPVPGQKTTIISITTPERLSSSSTGNTFPQRKLSTDDSGKRVEILLECGGGKSSSSSSPKVSTAEDKSGTFLSKEESTATTVCFGGTAEVAEEGDGDDAGDLFMDEENEELEDDFEGEDGEEDGDESVAVADPKYVESLIAQLQSGSNNLEFIQNDEGLYVCMFCSKTFIHKYPYRDHLKTHTGEGPRCPICNKIFPKNHNLMLHLRTHTGEKPFQCDVCLKDFADKSNLKVHYRVHTGEKPYKCECGQAFVNSSRLVVHRHRCGWHSERATNKQVHHDV